MAYLWTGKLKLRSGTREADAGAEVTARIVLVATGKELIVDVSKTNDAFGQPRWEPTGAFALDQASLCAALARTGTTIPDPPAITTTQTPEGRSARLGRSRQRSI